MPYRRGIDVLAAARKSLASQQGAACRNGLRLEALALAQEEQLVEAAYSCCIIELDEPASEWLHAGGESFHAPWLLPKSGKLTALGCAVGTIGPGIERRVSRLFGERRASLALALDQLGNELLFEVSRLVQDRLLAEARRRGLDMAGELRPGDPGLSLDAQPGLLRLAGAQVIGVGLNEDLLMSPHKSGSMVLGIGRNLPLVSWSRCQHCRSRTKCRIGAVDGAVG